MSRFFIDMDGVVARFHPEKSIEEIMTPGYFENLEPVMNVINAIEKLSKYSDVYILSAVFGDVQAREKKHWGERYLPFLKEDRFIFVPYGEKKMDYINDPQPEDILVDDFSKNLFEWSGVGIKLLNGINHTKGSWKGYLVNGEGDEDTIFKTLFGISLTA